MPTSAARSQATTVRSPRVVGRHQATSAIAAAVTDRGRPDAEEFCRGMALGVAGAMATLVGGEATARFMRDLADAAAIEPGPTLR